MVHLHTTIPNKLIHQLRNQKYHMVGHHSAVKRCRWLYNTLIHDKNCYKQRFYGIKTHQCVQMTPSVLNCTMRCVFCWRIQNGDKNFAWDEMDFSSFDDPELIVEGCINAQMKLLSGYKANPKANKEKYREALSPRHVAISLAGEPTLYPKLGDLIEAFHKKGFTTFLVTNGTMPEVLSKLDEEPTQLYISTCAPDKETFYEICRPLIPNAWQKFKDTLALLPSFQCPTVLRITCVRHLNLKHPERYAKLIEISNPTYIEPKSYMHVGFSRLRLKYENMPLHEEIQSFASSLADETQYTQLDESRESRIVLLSRLEKPIKLS
ncbi:MAG: 4-demethylwyosine synthase TYW1 [Candidatus Bathyarchaeota archaeon]|nr:MAG: 4-demethylwyosine synthase TYW1 [Candidatus Bathyarchaeota archaeon]